MYNVSFASRTVISVSTRRLTMVVSQNSRQGVHCQKRNFSIRTPFSKPNRNNRNNRFFSAASNSLASQRHVKAGGIIDLDTDHEFCDKNDRKTYKMGVSFQSSSESIVTPVEEDRQDNEPPTVQIVTQKLNREQSNDLLQGVLDSEIIGNTDWTGEELISQLLADVFQLQPNVSAEELVSMINDFNTSKDSRNYRKGMAARFSRLLFGFIKKQAEKAPADIKSSLTSPHPPEFLKSLISKYMLGEGWNSAYAESEISRPINDALVYLRSHWAVELQALHSTALAWSDEFDNSLYLHREFGTRALRLHRILRATLSKEKYISLFQLLDAFNDQKGIHSKREKEQLFLDMESLITTDENWCPRDMPPEAYDPSYAKNSEKKIKLTFGVSPGVPVGGKVNVVMPDGQVKEVTRGMQNEYDLNAQVTRGMQYEYDLKKNTAEAVPAETTSVNFDMKEVEKAPKVVESPEHRHLVEMLKWLIQGKPATERPSDLSVPPSNIAAAILHARYRFRRGVRRVQVREHKKQKRQGQRENEKRNEPFESGKIVDRASHEDSDINEVNQSNDSLDPLDADKSMNYIDVTPKKKKFDKSIPPFVLQAGLNPAPFVSANVLRENKIPNDDLVVLVESVPAFVSENDLCKAFSRCGEIENVSIIGREKNEAKIVSEDNVKIENKVENKSKKSKKGRKGKKKGDARADGERGKQELSLRSRNARRLAMKDCWRSFGVIEFKNKSGRDVALSSSLRCIGMFIRGEALRTVCPKLRSTLYVNNLDFNLTTHEVAHMMTDMHSYGDVPGIEIKANSKGENGSISGTNSGHCLIEYPNYAVAISALANVTGQHVDGKRLKVRWPKSKY